MQYGVLSDIHGDCDALIVVWKALERDGLTERLIFNAGDNVGYGDSPEAVCQFLREHPQIVSVQGNYDKNVANFPRKESDFREKWAKSRPDKLDALRRASRDISAATRAWLVALPTEASIVTENSGIIVTHYSPGSKNSLGAWTPDRELARQAKKTDANVVICGHTHSAFVRQAGGVLFINPGSVGMSSPKHPYAVLTLSACQPPTAELKEA